jgi:hypothetical protein
VLAPAEGRTVGSDWVWVRPAGVVAVAVAGLVVAGLVPVALVTLSAASVVFGGVVDRVWGAAGTGGTWRTGITVEWGSA